MGFEKWKGKIKKTTVPEGKWEELILPASTKALGSTVIKSYLQKDGDVIELDLKGKDRRGIGNFLKALNIAKTNLGLKAEFLLRYSEDFAKAYIKRVG